MAEFPQKSAALLSTAQQSQDTAQLSDLVEENKRLTARLSEMVTKESLAAEQEKAQLSDTVTIMLEHQKQLVSQLSDMTTTTVEHSQNLAADFSDKMAATLEHSQKLATQLINLNKPVSQPRSLIALPILKESTEWEEDTPEETWKFVLKFSLGRDDLYRHIEVDVPEPEDEAERQMWRADDGFNSEPRVTRSHSAPWLFLRERQPEDTLLQNPGRCVRRVLQGDLCGALVQQFATRTGRPQRLESG